jgi:hypothetical protein
MLPYALSKILQTQFILYPFSLQDKLESTPGSVLTWAFLGHSGWFQILLGFFELIPALLLLFRRTTLLGAILMLPITLNVVLINYALQLWHETKIISSVLLVLNLLVLIIEWKSVKALIAVIINKGKMINYVPIELIINTLIIVIAGYFSLKPLLEFRRQENVLITGDWVNQHPIEWTLSSEKLNDSTLKYRELKYYFGPSGQFDEIPGQSMSSNTYRVDERKQTLTRNYGNKETNIISNYTLLGDTALKFERTIDEKKNIKLTQIFVKRIMNIPKTTY